MKTQKQYDSVLIVGADSAIGRRLVAAFEASGKSVWQTTRKRETVSERRLFLDLSKDVSQWPLPSVNIRMVILCAAITSIEQCRVDTKTSRQVNVLNIVTLAKRFVNMGAFVIFLSTNAVFDGDTPFANPGDPVNPQTEYGRQKAEAEEQLQNYKDRVAIVRFSKVITPDIPLFNGWVRDLKARKQIHPFLDMVMAPISLEFAVEVLLQVSKRQLSGITQASAAEDITYTYAAQYISKKLGVDKTLIKPISFREIGITFSPLHTTLDSTRLAAFGLNPPKPINIFAQF